MSLSVVINTRNSASTLTQALDSVKHIADEIIIVDMQSTDETVAIAKKYTHKIFPFDDVGYVEPARNFALSKASQDWIFVLDADEEVSPGLAEVVQHIVSGNIDATWEADAYFIPRQNIIFNKKIEKTGWWPDYQMRLFKHSHVKWSDMIHSVPEVIGTAFSLPADEKLTLQHHNYQTVEQFVDRLNRYTTTQAISDKNSPTDGLITPASVVQAFSQEFNNRLFGQGGIDEGIHGTGLSFLQGMYQAIIQLKKWQSLEFPTSSDDQEETLDAIQAWQEELFFWVADWHVRHSTGVGKLLWKVRRKLKI